MLRRNPLPSRRAAAPRRSLHRRHAGGLTRPGARPDRTQPGRLGMGAPALLPRSRARPREKVRRLAVLPRTRLGAAGLSLNSHRPLFKNNPRLRRAELRRRPRSAAARKGRAGQPTSSCRRESRLPGCSYLSARAPNVRKARASLGDICASERSFSRDRRVERTRARAQVLAGNLEKIGLKVDIKTFPPTAYFAQIEIPGPPSTSRASTGS